jgi:DNA (cytosine-5)-methyltransferase 1
VLEEIGQESIPMPDNGKWAKAGMVQFQNCQVAWRVLDAQYWGVPQRRKRIFLVADFTGERAGKILFVEQGGNWDSAEGERAREEVARGTGKSVDSAVVRMRSGCAGGGKVPLVSNEKSLTLATGNDLPVVHSYCIAGNTIDRKPQNGGNGTGNQEELSYTLNTVDRHAVAECFPQNAYNKFLQGTPLTTLKACGGSCGGGSENLIVNISPSVGKVRRLTPTECERLQGLPDGFTDIEFKGKPALDSKRYKALGNGMAQPCADYVIKQIVRFVKGL